MAQGNRSLVQGLVDAATPSTAPSKLPPRTSVLQGRENRLAQMANGQSVNRVHELVDPARCRIWNGHNRDYAALGEATCADLIDSFKAQGRQEVPAIVRRVKGDPAIDFEVICGARRHWAAGWMREHGHPTFGYLVEPRELDDEEAFRVADLENRSRKDLSDLERARDYARAVDRFYGGNQQRMAERLQVTKSWLSRYLELARLPEPVLTAFGARHAVGISHAAQLAPLLRDVRTRDLVLAQAVVLGEQQERRAGDGGNLLGPAAVVQALVRATQSRPTRRRTRSTEHTVRSGDGTILVRGTRTARSALTIEVPHAGRLDHQAILDACQQVLRHLASPDATDAKGTRPRKG